jgi:hypothetical protein
MARALAPPGRVAHWQGRIVTGGAGAATLRRLFEGRNFGKQLLKLWAARKKTPPCHWFNRPLGLLHYGP